MVVVGGITMLQSAPPVMVLNAEWLNWKQRSECTLLEVDDPGSVRCGTLGEDRYWNGLTSGCALLPFLECVVNFRPILFVGSLHEQAIQY